jgi:hypothetical protein
MNREILQHLADAGIRPCSDTGDPEEDEHLPTLQIKKSFFMDCLEMEDGSKMLNVYVAVDKKCDCTIEFTEVQFSGHMGLGAEAVANRFKEQLFGVLRSFMESRGDLV